VSPSLAAIFLKHQKGMEETADNGRECASVTGRGAARDSSPARRRSREATAPARRDPLAGRRFWHKTMRPVAPAGFELLTWSIIGPQ
jgi:hypothetical protein